ncbi:MAG: hypothetical protein QNJ44_10220 [Rhodobacter sp.]|nr:hypothetical protein [Rhodobacter sp.]
MKSSTPAKALLCAAAASIVLGAAEAQAGDLTLQIIATQSTASAGNAKVSPYNRAKAEVLALDLNGDPVSDLAGPGETGDQTGEVSIPGWRINTMAVGAGGCGLVPIGLRNFGDGTYTLRLGTASTTAPCSWKPGDYVFSLSIGAGGRFGMGLGHFPIN